MATVELKGIGKVYEGGVRAVQDVNLAVADGEFVVLVGPSGCGKSTTLRMVAGLEEITEGSLTIDGRLVNDVPPRDRDIAMVFQNYALYPHMSVRQNLSFGLERRRSYGSAIRRLVDSGYRAKARGEDGEIAARVADAAQTLGITPYLDRKPRALSGGQRQRVAVGRALVRDPKVFLFDEPLSNLDAKLRMETRTELKALHRQTRATMMYVTHDQEEAMTLGDRLVVMKDGVVQQCADPVTIYERPANRFVASFVGTPTMNFIEGEVRGDTFRAPSVELRMDPTGPRVSGPVVLGIRPDRLRPAGAGTGRLRAQLRVLEHLGDRVDLALMLDCGTPLVCRTAPGAHLREGEPIDLDLDPADLHFFAADEQGLRLA
ncbi:ABC transporter ATP-binding protein [Engelhardtia mirabilis]|uniref:sn-glycerol-3-phosphate import ATP-binding protein UgpC n=1 Tax=Engelhardtia mirabilis TaxID=2528011 RepID=A0A518BLP2_9BACT|nr:sn-glycerol-3-phosphate import ATP-binding protein UgpC [Planctomycetes bacterium Pla133]QDV02209.1 sn-glycerol-3-phosphate import ATP-binding protein UgpC [Planctomycetes bacterium Pla86]